MFFVFCHSSYSILWLSLLIPFATGFSSPSTSTKTTKRQTSQPDVSPTGADLTAWAKGFRTCPSELSPTILEVPGLPNDFPIGTYYRNGHARFEADDGTPVLHPFDGDGMIIGMTFDPEKKRILFRNKFVETKGYMEDKRTGEMSERGIFGTLKSGGIFANAFRTGNKNVANTNVVYARDSLYALWEGGKPYKLNPLSLENIDGPGIDGESDLDGLLVKENFSAHYRYDPKNKVYVNFGLNFDPIKGSKITLFELDEDSFCSTKPSTPSIVSKDPGLIHDFILSENYCIFNINKCKLDIKNSLKALIGFAGFAGAIDIDQDASETSIVMIPRFLFDEKQEEVTNIDFLTDDRIIVIPVQNHFNFHFGNCYEDSKTGNIVFDTVQTKEISLEGMTEVKEPVWNLPNPFDLVAPNTLVRYTLDVKNKCLAEKPKTLSTRIPEFPSLPKHMSTRKHRYLYPVASHTQVNLDLNTKGSGPAGAIQKVDTEHPELSETFTFEPFEFPGEAVFVAKNKKDRTEDAGYLLVIVVNGKDLSSDLCIFDVEGEGTFEQGPVVRQKLPVFLPHMLHGHFFEGVTFDF